MRTIVNTGQAEAWNGYEGGHWAANQDRYDAVNSGFNTPLLDAAAIGERDHVLDVGCGNGQLTRLAARRARDGRAAGVDLSGPMLARARASSADVPNVTFEQGDAQVHAFPAGAYDVAVSRFGVMFFADPVAAFANIGSALRPGGPAGPAEPPSRSAGATWARPSPRSRRTCRRPWPPGRAPRGRSRCRTPAGSTRCSPAPGSTAVNAEPVEAPQVWGHDAGDAAGFLGSLGSRTPRPRPCPRGRRRPRARRPHRGPAPVRGPGRDCPARRGVPDHRDSPLTGSR